MPEFFPEKENARKKRPPVEQKEEGSQCDFQGYHHRRQKELIANLSNL